jgi:sec-independent protein translocase protein TatB
MFDLDPGKLIVIGIVALIAIPSKDLPRVLRTLGQYAGRMRRMASEFQGQFMDAMRESELDDLRKEVDAAKAAISDSVKLEGAFDPMAEARKQVMSAIEGGAPADRYGPRPEEALGADSKDDSMGALSAAHHDGEGGEGEADEPQKAKE